MEKWQNQTTKELFRAFLGLKTQDETTRFLRDLLTSREIIEFGKRWKAACMLSQRKSYLVLTSGVRTTIQKSSSNNKKTALSGGFPFDKI